MMNRFQHHMVVGGELGGGRAKRAPMEGGGINFPRLAGDKKRNWRESPEAGLQFPYACQGTTSELHIRSLKKQSRLASVDSRCSGKGDDRSEMLGAEKRGTVVGVRLKIVQMFPEGEETKKRKVSHQPAIARIRKAESE